MTTSFDPNITDVALIFEGGGMRAAYTAAVVTRLLEEGINLVPFMASPQGQAIP